METVRKVLLDPKVPAYRKATLLRTFGFDPGLSEVAMNLYVNGKDIDIQAAAFRYLRKSISSERLADLARPILKQSLPSGRDDYLLLQQQAAETMAGIAPWDKELNKYLESKKNAGHYLEPALVALAMLDKISTNSALSFQPISDAEKTRRIELAVPHLAKAIEAGARVTWASAAAGKPLVAFERAGKSGINYHTISTPRALLTPALGNALVDRLGRNTAGLSTLVHAVSGAASDKKEFGSPFRIALTLTSNDRLETTTGDILTGQRLGNPLYLERDSGAQNAILVRWRDIDGVYKIAYLRHVALTKSDVKIVAASSESDQYLDNFSYNAYFD